MRGRRTIFVGVLIVLSMALTACIQPLSVPETGESSESDNAVEVGPPLEGQPWQLTQVVDENGSLVDVVAEVEVTATFVEGTVSGSDGCNNYTGSYTVDGTALTISPNMAMTMMACPEPIMQQSSAYLAALEATQAYRIVDNQLQLLDESSQPVALFDERMPTSLTGTMWNAIGYNNGKEAVVSIIIDTEITAIFSEDGTLSGSAGCNNYTAGYEADETEIQIGPAAVSMMMCPEPEDIMEQESLYLAALEMAEVYAIDGDRLQLRTSEGSLVADYRAAGPASEAVGADGSDAGNGVQADANGEEITMYVGPTMVSCTGVGPQTCMLVKNDPDEEYTYFYEQIDGFEYVPGYEYELQVLVEERENVPADASSLNHSLIEVVSSTEVGPTLENQPWQLTSLVDDAGQINDALAEVEVTATFEDGMITGKDGCNNYSGSYTVDGTALTISPNLAMTMMACPDPIMQQSGAYLAALEATAAYQIVDNQLVLLNESSQPLAIFEERVPVSLTDTTWFATGYNNGTGGVTSLVAGSTITALFDEEGTLSGSAGCNNYSAGYELDGDQIQIGPAAATMMMCPDAEVMLQEVLYLASLGMAEIYSIDSNKLELRTGEGALVASYEAMPAADDMAASDEDNASDGVVAQEESSDSADDKAADASAAPEIDTLANMEYQSEYTVDGTAPLQNGEYSEEAAPGSATKTTVRLSQHIAVGELNGQPAAAVVLVSDPGGSGTFYDLALVMEQDGKPTNVATVHLGDRVQINSITVEENQIVVDMVQSGPDDPMCCPSQHVIKTFALEDDELVETSSEVVDASEGSQTAAAAGTASAQSATDNAIVGKEWHWFEFESGNEHKVFVQDPNRYTLTLNPDGSAVVLADCNRGNGTYVIDGSSISIDIVAVTRALCPPTSRSDDYLRLLSEVDSYVEEGDELILHMMDDAGILYFQSADATEAKVHDPTAVFPQDAISLDPGTLATSYHWQVLPPTQYDASMPPVPSGAPARAVVTFDYTPAPTALVEGGPYIVVYPIQEYIDLWQAAGNDTIASTVESLQTLLSEQPASPQAPLPVLPPPGGRNDLAVQTAYLDFGGGNGIRFVGRISQDASQVLNGQLAYYFQGLTNDGQFYVSLRWPIATDALPNDMSEISAEEQEAVNNDFDAYMQETTDLLNGMASSDWEPTLDELDALVSSFTLSVPVEE